MHICTEEPEPGSVVLLHGLRGTAYQRHSSDGLFHPTTDSPPVTFAELESHARRDGRPLLLVHDTAVLRSLR